MIDASPAPVAVLMALLVAACVELGPRPPDLPVDAGDALALDAGPEAQDTAAVAPGGPRADADSHADADTGPGRRVEPDTAAVCPTCGVRTFTTTGDVLAGKAVSAVHVWDATLDGGAWRAGLGTDWAAEAGEQYSGRSLVMPGADGSADESIPVAGLPLGTLAGGSAITVSLRARVSQRRTAPLDSPAAVPAVPRLVVYDGAVFVPDVAAYCGSSVARLDEAVALGAWTATPGVCSEGPGGATPASCHAAGQSAPELAIQADTWHHLALTAEPEGEDWTVRWFLDGALVFSSTRQAPKQAGSTLRLAVSRIEGSGAVRAPVDVAVDDVRVFAGVLSAPELAAEAAGTGSATPAARWTFDEPSEALTLAGGARRSYRSSRAALPDVAHVIATEGGLDVLDAETGIPWMRFAVGPIPSPGPKGVPVGHLIESGPVAMAVDDAVIAMTTAKGTHVVSFDPGQGLGASPEGQPSAAATFAPGRRRLTCWNDPCDDPTVTGACLCGTAHSSVACRNGRLDAVDAMEASGEPLWLPQGLAPRMAAGTPSGCFGAVPTVFTAGDDGLNVVAGFQYSGTTRPGADQWPGIGPMAVFGNSLYVVRYDTSGCARITDMGPDFLRRVNPETCGPTPGFSFWTGWLEGAELELVVDAETSVEPVPAGTSPEVAAGLCAAAIVVNDLFVSDAGAGHERFVLATQESVRVVEVEDSLTVDVWRSSDVAPGKDHVAPAPGPYTAARPCGGWVYVGTAAHGVFRLDPDAPDAASAQWSDALPDVSVTALACSEVGPESGTHRVLVGTAKGAAEIVEPSK